MSRDLIPFVAGDISALAKSLRGQLAGLEAAPSHVEMLNMLARATGHRNFQHFRAQAVARERLEAEPTPEEPVDQELVLRLARYFDDQGRMTQWPAKLAAQRLCLWGLWSQLPAEGLFTEREINVVLQALHLFGDPAILRRSLAELQLVSRTLDGRDYRRVERKPPPDAAALIRHISARKRQG